MWVRWVRLQEVGGRVDKALGGDKGPVRRRLTSFDMS